METKTVSSAYPATFARSPHGVRRWRVVALGVAGGIALWLSFYCSYLVWLSLVPLGVMVRLEVPRRWLYLAAWLGGLAFFFPATEWLRYGDPSLNLGWPLLAVYLSLYFPAFLLLARVLQRRWKVPVMIAMPAAWVALEYARMFALSGFGWLLLAHPISHWTWTIQIADLGGVYAVSFLVATINALVVELLTLPLFVPAPPGVEPWFAVAPSAPRDPGTKPAGKPAVPMCGNPQLRWRTRWACFLVAATLLYGWYRTTEVEFTTGPTLALIHTTLPQSLKLSQNSQALNEVMEHVLELTRQAAGSSTDLVVWPETSYPYAYGDIAETLSDLEISRLRISRRAHLVRESPEPPSPRVGALVRGNLNAGKQDLTEIADELGKCLLVSVIRHDYRPGFYAVYNASVLFAPGEGAVEHYDKLHLVPFGEYLPLEGVLPLLTHLVPYELGIDFGLDEALEYRWFHKTGLHFASLICFEDTLPHLARGFMNRQLAERPIAFFINQSNDGWFEGTVEPQLHLAASVFRCVETRRAMARVANFGVSTIVDPNGAVRSADGFDPAKPAVITAPVPLDERTTPYVRWGDWLPILCSALCITGVAMSGARQVRRLRRR